MIYAPHIWDEETEVLQDSVAPCVADAAEPGTRTSQWIPKSRRPSEGLLPPRCFPLLSSVSSGQWLPGVPPLRQEPLKSCSIPFNEMLVVARPHLLLLF